MKQFLNNWAIVGIIIPVLIGLLGHFFLYRILLALAGRAKIIAYRLFIKHCYRAFQWIIVILSCRVILHVRMPEEYLPAVNQALSLLVIAMVSLLLVKGIYVLDEYVLSRFRLDAADNLRARKIHTQLRVLKQIVIVVVSILALGMMLMTFEKVRQLGTTILASAGIIGIVVGMAAQRTLATFIAGLQIAFTQPIRLDDIVIVENEFGRIEEITLTYVVVKIWDLRRLVVPINYFIEKPFQNWTRVTADLLGTVFIYVDYTVPVEAVRAELANILNASDLWDKKVCALQVTNTSEKAVELRALMSASDASKAWSLRCRVREKLIEFIQTNYPQSLPKFRLSSHSFSDEKKEIV